MITTENIKRRAASLKFIFSIWTLLGLIGTCFVSYFGAGLLASNSPKWWYVSDWPGAQAPREALFYFGIFLVCISWLIQALRLAGDKIHITHITSYFGKKFSSGSAMASGKSIGVVILLWSIPLVLGPSLFSQDMYSYLAQGELWHLGYNPYSVAPITLGHLHQIALLRSVSPFWRKTTSPYGPLFIAISSFAFNIAGGNLQVAIILLRLVEVFGVALTAYGLDKLAQEFDVDRSLVRWVAIGSPLVLFDLISAGHNDALMVALVVIAVWLARNNKLALSFLLLAVAVTIKVPAVLPVYLLVICIIKTQATFREKCLSALRYILIFTAMMAGLSIVLKTGLDWITTNIISAPGKVHLAITLSTELGITLGDVLSKISPYLDATHLEPFFAKVNVVAFILILIRASFRVRWDNLVINLATLFICSVILGPATWPWYFSWGIVFVVLDKRFSSSAFFLISLVVVSVLVKPNGILDIPSSYAPLVLALGLAAYLYGRRIYKPLDYEAVLESRIEL